MTGLVTLNADDHPCQCCTKHVPAPRRTVIHHILPLSWGGPDIPSNKIVLCDTGHYIVHWHLDRWKRTGSKFPRSSHDNAYLYDVASRGWDKLASRAMKQAKQ